MYSGLSTDKFFVKDNALEITNFDWKDEGIYFCVVEHEIASQLFYQPQFLNTVLLLQLYVL